MKANGLMIGDWIEPHQCRIPTVYARVEGIYPDGITIDKAERVFSFDEIRPIPLTPEILEKNGWVKNLYSFESYDNEELERLSLWVGEDGKNKWWWHVSVELVTPINYVHELQHALILCGIKKEIIL